MKPVLYTWGYSADGEEFALWTLLPRSNGVMREAEIILLCVRWSLRYALSYRDLEEMMLERGSACRSHHDVPASVQQYAPELEKRSRPHLKATNDSWRVDETSIKIKTTWTSLYRAVDSEGNTLEFLFSPTRDAEAAKRITPYRFSFSSQCDRSESGSVLHDGYAQSQQASPARHQRGEECCVS